jgi:hypothetical protein
MRKYPIRHSNHYKIGYVTNEEEAKPRKLYRRQDSVGIVMVEMKEVATELFGSS